MVLATALAACSRDAAVASPPAQASAQGKGASAADPVRGLNLDADAAAAALGSFAWEGEVRWTVAKPGATPIATTEHHHVRQLATGDFEISSDIDPGGGPGSESGKHVVFVGRMVYGRERWAPFRERPGDRGHEARRYRDDSFRVAADLVALLGPALEARDMGQATFLSRRAHKFELSLSPRATSTPTSSAAPATKDPDTARRRAFLQGRVPTAAAGELLVDGATGVPLEVRLHASFTQASDPSLSVEVDLSARMQSLGPDVAPVQAPTKALPDDRKPKGVARALEAAGLRKRAPRPEESEDEAEER